MKKLFFLLFSLFYNFYFVNAQCNITLISGTSSVNQAVCLGTSISNINYSTISATNAFFTGLPTGVVGTWSSNSINISGTPVVSGVYNFVVTLTGCTGGVNSASGTITVYSQFNSGVLRSFSNICYDTSPDTLRFNIAPTGGGGSYGYQWQDSVAGGNWADVAGATSSSYRPGNLQQTRFYRVRVQSLLGCGFLFTPSSRVLVYLPFSVGSIVGADTVCYNTRPDTMRVLNLPTGGDLSYSYQWLESLSGNGPWAPVVGQTGTTYRPGNLLASRYYRLLMRSGSGCGVDSSNVVMVRAWLDVVPAQAGANSPSICYDSSTYVYRLSGASGSDGNFSYQWQRKQSGIWTNISGATSDTFYTGSLQQTTQYRLRTISAFGCSDKFSDSVVVQVYSQFNSGVLRSFSNICYDTSPDTLRFNIAPTGGGGSYGYQWQDSVAGGNWADVAGATSSSYRPGNLQQTRFYRVRVQSLLGCGFLFTPSSRVLVYLPFSVGSIVGADTVCYNTRPDTMRVLNLPTGGDLSYSYQWLESLSGNGPWAPVVGQTGTTYRPGNLLASRYYRLLMRSGSGCGVDSSNVVMVWVNPLPDTSLILGPNLVCKNQADVQYILSKDSSLYRYEWNITKGIIQSGRYSNRVFIKWNDLNGIDTIKVIQTNRLTGCTNMMTYVVQISQNRSPDRSILIRKPNTNMLICSDSSIGLQYAWGWILSSDSSVYVHAPSSLRYFVLPHAFDSIRHHYFVKTINQGCETYSFLSYNPIPANVFLDAFNDSPNIFPNPTDGYLCVKFSHIKLKSIFLFDSFGNIVLEQIQNIDSLINLDLSFLSPGVYRLYIVEDSIKYANNILLIKK